VHEVKVDGYRAQLHIRDATARVFSRRGNDWTERFASIAHDALRLPVKQAVIDGEVIVAAPDGLSDFNALQTELANERSDRMTFYAFDLLYADGFDLRRAPLVERSREFAEGHSYESISCRPAWRIELSIDGLERRSLG
jgi:bifunctional non-homologous end joining protein LigD